MARTVLLHGCDGPDGGPTEWEQGMSLMEWSPALDVGVDSMNREHRDILMAINAIYDGAQAGYSGAPMMAKIARLGDVTTRHFADEERFMQSVGFPGFSTHKAIHDKVLKAFTAHVATIQAAGGRPTKEFFQFLHLWLSAHIKRIDRQYGDHVAQGGAKAA